MVFERSVNSKVFHRRGCGFLKSVRPENMTAFDLEFGERTGLNPCKCCCSLKHIARRWSHFNTYKDIKLVEIGDDFLMIAAPKRTWSVKFDPSSQYFQVYRVDTDEENGELHFRKENSFDKQISLNQIAAGIKKIDRVSDVPEAFRNQYSEFRENAQQKRIKFELDGKNIYLLTDVAAWKISCDNQWGEIKLFHSPFKGTPLTMAEAKNAYYHRQVDVPAGQGLTKNLIYICLHDSAKKVSECDYKKLPQETKKQKKYYEQAKKRARKRSVRNVYSLFEQLEANENVVKFSIC